MAELDRVRSIGRAAYVEEQLVASDPDVENMAVVHFPRIALDNAALLAASGNGLTTNDCIQDLQQAALYRALFSGAQLQEVMVDFWNDHFNTYIRKNPIALKLDLDRSVIRANAMGNFKTLLKAVVYHAEMLRYLDNYLNTQTTVNENYARELMELHTLGREGGYTAADIKALARILTGLTYQTGVSGLVGTELKLYGDVIFWDHLHDPSEKVFMGEVFPEGGGEEEIQRALQILVDHPSTARFISTKLCQRFVADEVSDELVDEVTAVFIDTDGDIKSMLRYILNAPEFLASAGEKFKRPMHAMVGAMRACGVNQFDALLNTDQFGVPGIGGGLLLASMGQAGQEPFAWVPPNGYPDTASFWSNTNSLLYQQRFLVEWVEGTAYGRVLADPNGVIEGTSVAEVVADGMTPRQVVTNAVANLLFMDLPVEAFDAALDFVAQGEDPDAEISGEVLAPRVKGLVFVLLSSPWFLLR